MIMLLYHKAFASLSQDVDCWHSSIKNGIPFLSHLQQKYPLAVMMQQS